MIPRMFQAFMGRCSPLWAIEDVSRRSIGEKIGEIDSRNDFERYPGSIGVKFLASDVSVLVLGSSIYGAVFVLWIGLGHHYGLR